MSRNSLSMGRMKEIFYVLTILASILSNCTVEETLKSGDANSQIYSAISYKAKECGNPIPEEYLYVVSDKVPQRNIDLCTFAILRTNCPLNAFPQVCILIYLEEFGDIPQSLNFNDYVNQKF